MHHSRQDVKALAAAGADNVVLVVDEATQADTLARLEALAGALF
jgi:hypothetical protein